MTTVEGGMVSTNDKELYDLMRMKRSHGMARNSITPEKYSALYPEIHKSFLFVTDGYNFRNTEFSAVLGLSQLKRLNKFIEIRKNNYLNFYDILSKYTHLFYPISYHGGNSCFCFPLISKDKQTKDRLIKLFDEYGIEHRPVVGGNLLRQPFLSNISADCPNADVIHTNGIYIGNSQFVSKHNMEVLRQILNAL
jgi:CDP-6-deoxy-D-xylo-4-hexulose-3-dehydrase